MADELSNDMNRRAAPFTKEDVEAAFKAGKERGIEETRLNHFNPLPFKLYYKPDLEEWFYQRFVSELPKEYKKEL